MYNKQKKEVPLQMIRVCATLALVTGMIGCAATQQRSRQQDNTFANDEVRANHLMEELDESLAKVPPPPAPIPEPPPMAEDPKFQTWSGFVLIGTDHDGVQAVALPVEDGVINDATLEAGKRLPRVAVDGGWRFDVPGSIIFHAVHVLGNGFVVGEVDLGHNWAGTTVLVHGFRGDTDDGTRPCAHGICGDIYKLDTDAPFACKGPRCAEFFPPCAPKQGTSL